jgi:hypothetical protein
MASPGPFGSMVWKETKTQDWPRTQGSCRPRHCQCLALARWCVSLGRGIPCHLPVSAAVRVRVLEAMRGRNVWKPS